METPRQYADYDDRFWSRVEKALEKAALSGRPKVAAFDADGTLWDTDIGESFFQYQQDKKLVPLPENPWEHYDDLKKNTHPRTAYLWLAQISAGLPLETVRAQCRDHASTISESKIFPAQKKLIKRLHEEGFDVYVVTASVKWPVAAVAKKFFDIEDDKILGIEVKVENGILTEEQNKDITWREGKKTRLLEATSGVSPIISAGNTLGDQHLIESATEIQLAVSATTPESRFFEEESEFQDFAKSKKWTFHRF